ncbi:hypothetical protein KIN20_008005 [Parelaphostrongylus tenuis]|uniref:GST N-terminal domain-containing protein n=1 Tax=Parelaphostrongylus tenuis TaxID=148309 RepID=A0AAD5MN75_PARTN|nr:hypothetical protein KIN20_008005 [Parelaphostrongylus tenuis]
MMEFQLPHFVLHDFSDGEESKVIRMILTYARVPYECKDVDRDNYILEDYPFYTLPMLEVNERKTGQRAVDLSTVGMEIRTKWADGRR